MTVYTLLYSILHWTWETDSNFMGLLAANVKHLVFMIKIIDIGSSKISFYLFAIYYVLLYIVEFNMGE